MIQPAARVLTITAASLLALTGSALLARPGGFGGPGWGPEPRWSSSPSRTAPSLEGSIDVARFRAEGVDPAAIAKGAIAVIAMPSGPAEGPGEMPDARFTATFAAAVEGQLVNSGYRIVPGADAGDQIAEVRIVRVEAVPAEEKHKPLSGSMTMGVSNRGSMMGMALQYDGSKPRPALIATRLETRVRDRVTGQVLWEGRAQLYSRDGDERWNDDRIAARLAAALFAGYPNRTGEGRERR